MNKECWTRRWLCESCESRWTGTAAG